MWFLISPIVAPIAKAFKQKRTCPQCRKEQTVSTDSKHSTVKCTNCGADIPPPKKYG